ncbi:GIY-YIG nuclease family protein [Aequorivita viscosa]|nr:GIY-YIG nuclease family protein [Aequorivita viscosa]
MFFVYAISSLSKNYIYVGMTDDIDRRLKQHNGGYERTTKPYCPYILLYSEVAGNRVDARLREKYWKSGTGKRQLRKMRDSLNK